MDRKSVLILAVSVALLMLWLPLINKWFPPIPLTPEEQAARAQATNQTLIPTDTNATAATTQRQPQVPVMTEGPAGATQTARIPTPQGPEETESLETDSVRYTFTSHGGGLKKVELLNYPAKVGRQARRDEGEPGPALLNADVPLPIFAILGSEALPADGGYELTKEGGGLRAETVLPSGLHVIKEFLPSTNYLLKAAVRIENTSTQAIQLPAQEWVVGTATPIDSHDRGLLVRMQWFDGQDDSEVGDSYFANRTLGCFPGTPRSTYLGGNSNVFWASVQNQFFAVIAIPPSNAPAAQLVARKLELPRPPPEVVRTDRRAVAEPFGIQTALAYPGVVLQPGEKVERWFDLFAGPKEYRTLDRLSSSYGNDVDLVMGFGGFFGFFAKALLLSMNGLHSFGLSYGLSIIVITIIIKLLFWPLTQASTRSMKRMQKLQPEMKELQAKYKDDPKKMNERMMAFMKEHRINPAAGCLPILIQIPVFFGFFKMLRSAIELRGAGFLWAVDLSQPDTIWEIPGLGFPVNPLPIIMGLTQFWQMRMTPPSPGMDPVQQKIFQFMPLMFLFILYNFSSGLTLYWTVQNLLTIAQMKLTRSTGEENLSARHATKAKGKGKAKQLHGDGHRHPRRPKNR